MAEAIILPLARSILKAIASFTGELVKADVGDEFKAVKSVKEDLKAIAEDLESITAVLVDADAKQYSNAAMKIWLRDLRSVVYDIDDLLDDVCTDALQKTANRGHFLPQVRYYLSLKPLIWQLYVSRKIKDLRLELERIVIKKSRFGLTDRPLEARGIGRDFFDSCDYVNKVAIVGRDKCKNKIIDRLTSSPDDVSLLVLPILGMGGIGKTALAKLVYHDIYQFDINIWACVSDKFDMQKLLQDILKDATHENPTNYSLGDLIRKLRGFLNGKKFFLVLDDMWEDDVVLWQTLKGILDVGTRGSVVLITTRSDAVASTTKTTEPYRLGMLPYSVCWSIFKNLAFAIGEEERYPRLCKIGELIVKKCAGIPLVVQSLGSLLRSERDQSEWERIKDMENLNQLDGRYDKVKRILKMSYDKLPSHLKASFVHLSLFAKGCVYAPYYDYYFCSALGLLKLKDGSYFNKKFFIDLLSRSMLQDVEWKFNNTINTFKIHDILHDLAADILGEELAVVSRNKFSVLESSRYIAWESSGLLDEEFPQQFKAKKARAFVFRFQMRSLSEVFLKGVISNMPCLRVLAVGSSQFERLPSSIGNLKHLRLLDLSKNGLIKSLPDTVCKLLNLECLLLDGCKQLEELPSEIYKLTNLRYFSLTICQRSLVGTNINQLPSLRHMWFDSCMSLESFWDNDDVGCLTSLRSLRIVNCPKLTSLPDSMKLLVELEELLIANCKELNLESGEGLSGLQSLHTLAIQRVPKLSCLPNGICCSAASSLQYLYFSDCIGLKKLPEKLQSFVSLQGLVILNCRSLLSLPKGIQHLTSLQSVEIDSSPHLSRRFAEPTEHYLSLIQQVHVIWLDGSRLTLDQL